jgi:hypothetical protein
MFFIIMFIQILLKLLHTHLQSTIEADTGADTEFKPEMRNLLYSHVRKSGVWVTIV